MEKFNEVRKEAADLSVRASTLPNKEMKSIPRRVRRALAHPVSE